MASSHGNHCPQTLWVLILHCWIRAGFALVCCSCEVGRGKKKKKKRNATFESKIKYYILLPWELITKLPDHTRQLILYKTRWVTEISPGKAHKCYWLNSLYLIGNVIHFPSLNSRRIVENRISCHNSHQYHLHFQKQRSIHLKKEKKKSKKWKVLAKFC